MLFIQVISQINIIINYSWCCYLNIISKRYFYLLHCTQQVLYPNALSWYSTIFIRTIIFIVPGEGEMTATSAIFTSARLSKTYISTFSPLLMQLLVLLLSFLYNHSICYFHHPSASTSAPPELVLYY